MPSVSTGKLSVECTNITNTRATFELSVSGYRWTKTTSDEYLVDGPQFSWNGGSWTDDDSIIVTKSISSGTWGVDFDFSVKVRYYIFYWGSAKYLEGGTVSKTETIYTKPYSSWSWGINSGDNISKLTADKWNSFIRLMEQRKSYIDQVDREGYYSSLKVSSGQAFTSNLYANAANYLNMSYSSSKIKSGKPIYASYLDDLVTACLNV